MANTPKIRIPAQHLPGIRYISLLSEDEINLIYETLRQVPKGVNRKGFLQAFTDTLKFDNVQAIAESIFSFGELLRGKGINSEELAKDLTTSFEILQLQHEEDEIEESQKSILQDRLNYILLNCDSLKAIFEAFKIINDSDNILRGTEILTNVHLLLEDNAPNKSGFIFHRLKIDFNHDNKLVSKSFTLDTDDLKELKSQIEDALLKEEGTKTDTKGIINFIELAE